MRRTPISSLTGRRRGWAEPYPSRAQRSLLACVACDPMEACTQIREGNLMSVISWLLLGLVAGFVGSRLYGSSGQGLLLDVVLGIVGAVVGGLIFSFFGATGVTGFNFWSLIVAVIGSLAVLYVYHNFIEKRG